LDCAKAYVAEGAKVVLVARGKDALEKAAAELGPEHMGMTCDVSRGDEVKAAIEKTLSNYGRLDAVHNNAGIGSPSKPQIPLEKHGERPKICIAPFIGFAI
jgi:NAD(P)-dependent dehydrogenase (short-subunit alcohol dehydrogenase family)